MRCCGCWADTGYERAKKVIKSCETFDHLAVAHKYVNLALKKVAELYWAAKVEPAGFEKIKLELLDLLGKQEMKIRKKPYEKTKPIN